MSKNHKPYDEKELKAADETAYALGELSPAEAAQFERNKALSSKTSEDSTSQIDQTRRLGKLLRADLTEEITSVGSISAESTRGSTEIRELVLAALDSQETTPATKPDSHVSGQGKRRRIWVWGLVASIAVAIGGLMVRSVQVDSVQTAALDRQNRRATEIEAHHSHESNMVLPAGSWNAPESKHGADISIHEMPSGRVLIGGLASDSTSSPIAQNGIDAKITESIAGRDRRTEEAARETGLSLQQSGVLLRSLSSNSESSQNSFAEKPSQAGAFDRDAQGAAMGGKGGDNRPQFGYLGSPQIEGGRGANIVGEKVTANLDKLFGFGMGTVSDLQIEGDESESWKQESLRRNSANEQYRSIPENPFWRPIGERAMSTFSIDVDTASYANVRRFLNEGSLPPAEAVRLEEFVNYFHYEYPQPEGNEPFAVDLKLFGCPWNAQHSLLRVGLQGREIKAEKRPISNIVYLVDVSGSMSSDDKLPLLKRRLAMMVDHLSENDTVSIVTYAGNAGVRLEPTNGSNKKKILDAIDLLGSGGSTNGAAGIEAAYQLAQQNFVQDGANRVILMTDGDLNVGVTSDEALVTLIKEKAASGVFLTVLGFGTGNLKDAKLEGLADNGNGIYGYIDSLGEAHKVLVAQMSGSLVTIAKDVKIQIEFNPAQVAGYRLIGYENRVMPNQDFANDRKDAGEINAGHTVTALYEIVPVGATLDSSAAIAASELRYQTPSIAPSVSEQSEVDAKSQLRLTEAAQSGELARVALRYKTPEGTESRLIEFTTKSEVTSFSQADADCRFAAAVAAFGMHLRQSQFAGNMTLDAIAEIASAAIGNDPSGHRAEFATLVRRAKELQSNFGK